MMTRRIFVGVVIVAVGANVVLSGLVRPAIARHLAESDQETLQGKAWAAAYQLAGGN